MYTINFKDGSSKEFESLKGANLKGAFLKYTNLQETNLKGANLQETNLKGANLEGVNLEYANLEDTILENTNLKYVNLQGANLQGADLEHVKVNNYTTFFALQCPEEGSFIGYKKARGKIIKLLITEDAKRSSATSRKCRCSKAKVLEIEGGLAEICSGYDSKFIYKVGEIVEVKDFNEDRWVECTSGIHFFITKNEAINY